LILGKEAFFVPLSAPCLHTKEMANPDKFGCQRLRIYQLAHALGLRVHAMSLRLPSFEWREEGSQIRRSSKSVSTQIREGYGLRKYRDEFLHYLHRAAASADETLEHLAYLHETGSLKDAAEHSSLNSGYTELCASIGRFIIGVERDHSKPFYLRAGPPPLPGSRIENPESPGSPGVKSGR
jgi:four helix bundle protein